MNGQSSGRRMSGSVIRVPASSTVTVREWSRLRRSASTLPAEPAPMMRTSVPVIAQLRVWPPSTTRVWPVIQPAFSEARNATAGPMSLGTPRRANACIGTT